MAQANGFLCYMCKLILDFTILMTRFVVGKGALFQKGWNFNLKLESVGMTVYRAWFVYNRRLKYW